MDISREILLTATVFQLACLSFETAASGDKASVKLDAEVQGVINLVKAEMRKEFEATQRELCNEYEDQQNNLRLELSKKYQDTQNQFHELQDKFHVLEAKNNILEMKNNNLEQFVNSTHLNSYDVGRPPSDCVIGNNFRYHEFPDSYSSGVPYTLPAAGNRYQCLDLCRQDPTCLAVSFQKTSPHTCSAYSVDPAVIDPNNDWDYYRLEYTNSCWLDKPVVEFMTTIPTAACYGSGQILPFSDVVYDSGDGMKSDYKYHCPVSGTYRFTLIAVSYDTSGYTKLDIRINNFSQIAQLYFEKNDTDDTPGSVEVYAYCAAGDMVSVVSADSSCVYSHTLQCATSLSGRLVDFE